MPDLSVSYMGLPLKNPLIAGSSGLTASMDSLLELRRHGIGAVVLKSLFEEDLLCHLPAAKGNPYPYPRSGEYAGQHTNRRMLEDYLRFVEASVKALDIPVIASINCVTPFEWMSFSRQIEAAGASALELNMFIPPSDPMKNSAENEKVYFDILTDLRRQVKLPLAVKISPFFSGMTKMALKLSWTGISGLVLFNRYFPPDIDIEEMKVVPGELLSSPGEIALPLRWTAMLSDRVMCDIAGSTGVHDPGGVIRFLLAGAKAVQVASCLYKQGIPYVLELLEGLAGWMERHNFETTGQFIGRVSLKKVDDPADFERFQYLLSLHGQA